MSEVFRRIEKKYIVTKEQYSEIKKLLSNKMIEDEYGKSTVCNIYFDTEQFDLIRHSIEKPVYKDKVRLRSYGIPNLDDDVFLEIKRKFDGIVGKRRIKIKLKDYYDFKEIDNKCENKQILNELNYYFEFYKLIPTMFLSYDRRAFYEKDNKNFRLTFDSNIIARNFDLNLEKRNLW